MNKINNNDFLRATPFIPFSVYKQLPSFLSKCVRPFDDGRERDVMLTSCLTILSGCFSACRGKYGKDLNGPNLYAFIVAPPASGKGTMKYAQLLGKPIQDAFMENNKWAKLEYGSKLKTWSKDVKENKEQAGVMPEKPKYPVLYLPGNSSAAAIYNKLADSDGVGIICETEADTLTGAMKQDWGNFSDLLRKAFHHETLTKNRATNDEYLSIDNPHLSVLLTGTPDQVPKLIATAEDGLCSRFIFYCYNRKSEWMDPRPCLECPDIPVLLKGLSFKVKKVKEYLDENQCRFSLTEGQFDRLSENFRLKLQEVQQFEGSGAESAVFRMGLIAFRIAMVLTILRHMDDTSRLNNLVCSDDDFDTTLQLTDVYFKHAMVMYALLPKQSKLGSSQKLQQFYSRLPQQFERREANEIGRSIGISERTVGNLIPKCLEGGLLAGANGKYEKVDEAL